MAESPNLYVQEGNAFVIATTRSLSLPWWSDGLPEQQPGEYQAIQMATPAGSTRAQMSVAAGDTLHKMGNEMLLGKQPWQEVVATYLKAWLYGKHPSILLTLGQVFAGERMYSFALRSYKVAELYPLFADRDNPPRLEADRIEALMHSLKRAEEALPAEYRF